MKEAAYKGFCTPKPGVMTLSLGPSYCWHRFRKVQKHAARFVILNFDHETRSTTGIIGQLKWESFKKRRKDNRLLLLYLGMTCKARMSTNESKQ